MALAETARLLASYEFQNKGGPGVNQAIGQLGRLEGTANRTGGTLQRFASGGARSIGFLGNAISTALGVGLERAVSAGVGQLSNALRLGIEGAERLQTIQGQTAAAIKSTGSAAGLTAEDIRKLALRFEDVSAVVDDKVIQSGENLLLTFTNIRKNAFAPTIQAALDINQRLGGGEEGLAGVMLRLGRAMNNPAKGLALLQRSGISLDASTTKQILSLQKQNKLFDAQTILLDAISKRYGGSYAATANTAAGRTAKLRDALDDMRITFASAILPGIENVQAAVTKLFRDPATLTAIQGFGARIAAFLSPANVNTGIGALKEAFVTIKGIVATIPFATIGQSLKIAGQGAKFLLDAFVSMPSWVQTAVITGWGLNKLTGGIFGNIVTSLGTNLIKGVLGLNAGVVNITAATVNGPGGAGGGFGSFLTGPALPYVAAAAAAAGVAWLLINHPGHDPATVHPGFNETTGRREGGFDRSAGYGLRGTPKGTAGDPVHVTDPKIPAAVAKLYALPTGTSARAREAGPLPVNKPITAAEFERILKTTPFLGPRTGYKSTFETTTTATPARGGDPFGQNFLHLVSTLQNPKAPAVMFEIKGHLAELRNLEAYYIAHGDIAAATKVQGVIDSVDKLIGITEKQHPATIAAHKATAAAIVRNAAITDSGSRRVATILGTVQQATERAHTAISAGAQRTAQHLSSLEGLGSATAANTLATSRKNFSPTVVAQVGVTNVISVSSISQQIVRVTSGLYAGKPVGSGWTQ